MIIDREKILLDMQTAAFNKMKEYLFVCNAKVEARPITQNDMMGILGHCQKAALDAFVDAIPDVKDFIDTKEMADHYRDLKDIKDS